VLAEHPPEITWKQHWPASELDVDHPLTQACARAHEKSSGRPAEIHGFVAVCDAAFLSAQGIPSLVYGPGDILVAHAIDEYVLIDELVTAAKTFALGRLGQFRFLD